MAEEKREFVDIGLWESQKGGSYTTFLNDRAVQRLTRILELSQENNGGTLYVGPIKEEYQRKNGPTFKVDYIPPNDKPKAEATSEGV